MGLLFWMDSSSSFAIISGQTTESILKKKSQLSTGHVFARLHGRPELENLNIPPYLGRTMLQSLLTEIG